MKLFRREFASPWGVILVAGTEEQLFNERLIALAAPPLRIHPPPPFVFYINDRSYCKLALACPREYQFENLGIRNLC